MTNIAVITRTSNRPNYFQRCFDSVVGQPYVDSHHVIYDNIKDKEYLINKNLVLHYVNPSGLIYDEPAPESAVPKKRCLYNLYFNQIYSRIKSPWVYHLDDDNYLVDNAFTNLHPFLLSDDIDVIIVKVSFNNKELPSNVNFKQRSIVRGFIDTGCFLVRTNLAQNTSWDGWKCGDYRFIKNCVEKSKQTVWVNQIVMQQGDRNGGNKKDLIIAT